MRLFEKFPQQSKCPICGTNEDKVCFLMEIDGTQKENICEAQPTHADCIKDRLGELRWNKEAEIIYLFNR
jgi:hypothetical protein